MGPKAEESRAAALATPKPPVRPAVGAPNSRRNSRVVKQPGSGPPRKPGPTVEVDAETTGSGYGRLPELLAATLEALRRSLYRDVPPSALRDYWLWGLNPANPVHSDFVQAIGARQLCLLTATLLDGLIDDDAWPELIRQATTMNVYQLFEIVSDNLALGAGTSGSVQVLKGFNSSMVAALSGSPVRPAYLLAGIAPQTDRLSGFTHSLAGPAQQRMARRFATTQNRYTVADVEFGLWPALVANIVTARTVADTMADLAIGPTLRDGLVNRYLAVNRTYASGHRAPLELATLGAHAILVVPTLAYYVGALGEILRPDPGFAACVADGTLPDGLADAALLVRLLNDIGPGLLTRTATERRAVWRALREAYRGEPERYPTIDALLLAQASPVFTRLRKDLRHGEFNVALHGARLADGVPDALAALASAIDYFAMLYGLHGARLARGLTALGKRLADRRPLALLDRFVRFHAKLYANPYTDVDGEYAI